MTMVRACVIAYHSSPLQEPGAGDAGGMTVYVRELAAALAEQGVATDIFTRAADEGPTVTELGPEVRVVAIDAGPRSPVAKDRMRHHVGEFTNGVRAFAIGQRIGYDVIHSHYWQSGLAAKALAARWGIPLVHSHHTLGRVKNRWLAPGDSPEPAARLKGEQEVIDAADVLVASTAEEWRHLAELYVADPQRLKVLHPGVAHDLFAPGDRSEARRLLGLDEGPLLLCVGRIQPLKGLDLAIRALAELQTPARLLIVGGASGPNGAAELERLRSLTDELDVAERVSWAGAHPHRVLPEYYRAADALLVCSHSESFGLAALEAQSCGIPVIGTRVGGLPDVIGDGSSGVLVDERDPRRLAIEIDSLLRDPSRAAALGVAARQHALRYSWKTMAEDFLDLYECLIREESPEACTC